MEPEQNPAGNYDKEPQPRPEEKQAQPGEQTPAQAQVEESSSATELKPTTQEQPGEQGQAKPEAPAGHEAKEPKKEAKEKTPARKPRVEKPVHKRSQSAPADDDGLTNLERTLLEEMVKRREITPEERSRIEAEARLSKERKRLAQAAIEKQQPQQEQNENSIHREGETLVELKPSPKHPEEKVSALLPYSKDAQAQPAEQLPETEVPISADADAQTVATVARGEMEGGPKETPESTAAEVASEQPKLQLAIEAKPKIIKVIEPAGQAAKPSPRVVSETDYSMITNPAARPLARGLMINGQKIEPDLVQQKRIQATLDVTPVAKNPGEAFGSGEVLEMDEATRKQREADLAVKIWEQKQKEKSLVNRVRRLVGI